MKCINWDFRNKFKRALIKLMCQVVFEMMKAKVKVENDTFSVIAGFALKLLILQICCIVLMRDKMTFPITYRLKFHSAAISVTSKWLKAWNVST
jgi:hypothetical protein